MLFVGQIITLIPNSKKGKERIKRWGNRWKIVDKTNHCVSIVSVNDIEKTPLNTPDSSRWIDISFDPDFRIEL